VSAAFLEAIAAPERRVLGRCQIDFTDWALDQSLQVSASESANTCWLQQTADGIREVPHKWTSLDGSWVLDGSYRLAPGTQAEADRYQMGWWGAQLAGAGGAFLAPYPTLTITHFPRPVHTLRVSGDSARGEYPVDFAIRLYGASDVLLHTETVTGNADMHWALAIEPVMSVVRQELEITRCSHVGRQAKIVEFFTSIQQTFEIGDLLTISLLEEREVGQGTLPVGVISANEVSVRIRNDDRRFDADNAQSPLYQLLKPNRRVRAWLGGTLPDESVEWVPLGTYWTVEWQAPDDTVVAELVARDRLELLRKSTYQTSQVLSSVTLYDLADIVLQDAGLAVTDYSLDTALQSIVIPHAWSEPVSHREALRVIAEAALGAVYCDRDGVLRVEAGLPAGAPVLQIGPDLYFRADNPMRPGEVANEVIVETQPLRPLDALQEVHRSNEPVTVPAGQTVIIVARYNERPVIEAVASLEGTVFTAIQSATYYGWGAEITLHNPGGSPEDVTLVIEGRPLKVLNRQRAVARDEDSIVDLGTLRYELSANPLVQTLAVAQQLADAILATAKDPRRDLELEWRGNPALLLGDVLASRGGNYVVIRQELEWAGALRGRTTGRKVSA
jgi:hypothetical protein